MEATIAVDPAQRAKLDAPGRASNPLDEVVVLPSTLRSTKLSVGSACLMVVGVCSV